MCLLVPPFKDIMLKIIFINFKRWNNIIAKIARKQEGKFSNQALTLYIVCEANYLENQYNKETNLLTRKNGQSHIIDVIIAHVSSQNLIFLKMKYESKLHAN